MKKRIISLVLSVVVLVGCVVINNSNTASLTVGAGNGIDERFETANELSDFLEYLLFYVFYGNFLYFLKNACGDGKSVLN